ncbi:MAG: formate dehydrogenase accessory sulfurtransferase FdhD [bacterium]|nr:formate dehydrogenase accessory sulfurtransferase FdhD [bacterium]
MNEQVENFKVVRVKIDRKERQEDIVIKEVPLTIFLNGEELVTLLCTPHGLKYLAIGFLATEGFIKKREDIKDISLDQEKGIIKVTAEDNLELAKKTFAKRIIPSGCGKGTLFYSLSDTLDCSIVQSDIKVQHTEIFKLMKEFQRGSTLFRKTGGVHSCAICKDSEILKSHDDIGRHNALNKVLGECFLRGISTNDKLILTSGRISSDILINGAKWNISIIISRGAPTNLAIKLAERLGITLIGFVRGQRMNIYTHPEKVIVEGE